ncbi:MAG: hypothetical protein HQ464_14515 [Planctomycetes bacterium]|nr:hypothetical protein [Planctomycetota bacterium]
MIIENTAINLVPQVRCPNCWHAFAPESVLFIASSQDLAGDPRLEDPEERRRFIATRFRPDGAAVDEMGMDCRDLACPNCHLLVPRVLFEQRATMFLSIFGRPQSGKSYLLAAMMRQSKRLLPQKFGLGFTEPHPPSNRLVQSYENSLFNHPDPEALVDIPKTMSADFGGRLWYQVVKFGDEIHRFPRPMFFQVVPLVNHPNGGNASQYARTLCLYDNAGEDFEAGRQDKPNNPVTQHLARSSGLMFVFDPTQEPAFLRACHGRSADPQIEANIKVSAGEILDPQATILATADQNVKKFLGRPIAEPLETPLVVVVTKHDAWKHMLGGDLPAFIGEPKTGGICGLQVAVIEEISQRLRGLLMQHTPEVVAAAQRFSRHVYFVPVSATGCAPVQAGEQDGRPDYKFRAGSVSPYWIEVPLLWLLARHVQGLVPTEKRRPAAS